MTESEKRHLRSTFGKFATGVTIVSYARDGKVDGMTVNSFTSVSLDPPMLLFCPALVSDFAKNAKVGEKFTVSVLAHDQKALCLHFARRGVHQEKPWMEGSEDPPVIDGCLAYMRCETVALHLHGDHYVTVGAIKEWKMLADHEPLLFFSGQYPSLAPKVEE